MSEPTKYTMWALVWSDHERLDWLLSQRHFTLSCNAGRGVTTIPMHNASKRERLAAIDKAMKEQAM